MALLQVNPRCEIVFEGWESDSVRLGSHGWSMSLENDDMRGEKRLLLYHKESQLKMLAVSRGYDRYMQNDRFRDMYHGGKKYSDWNGPTFHVIRAATEFIFRSESVSALPKFCDWADTRPMMIEMSEYKLSETPLFLALAKPVAQEIIVEPQEVADLLEQIMKMQSPEQARIRKQRRQTEMPTACATILTLEAA